MGKLGKLLRIDKDRSVYIIADEQGNFISENNLIRYRDIGSQWDQKIVNERPVKITDGKVKVLSPQGKPDFYFPIIWLDTSFGRIAELQKEGAI